MPHPENWRDPQSRREAHKNGFEYGCVTSPTQDSTAQQQPPHQTKPHHHATPHNTTSHPTTLPHSTAQHSTAQHSTAQHSTVHPNPPPPPPHPTPPHPTPPHPIPPHPTIPHHTPLHLGCRPRPPGAGPPGTWCSGVRATTSGWGLLSRATGRVATTRRGGPRRGCWPSSGRRSLPARSRCGGPPCRCGCHHPGSTSKCWGRQHVDEVLEAKGLKEDAGADIIPLGPTALLRPCCRVGVR